MPGSLLRGLPKAISKLAASENWYGEIGIMAEVPWNLSGLLLLIECDTCQTAQARFGGLRRHTDVACGGFPRPDTRAYEPKPEEGVQFRVEHRSRPRKDSFRNSCKLDSPNLLDRRIFPQINNPASGLPQRGENINTAGL